MSMGTENSAGRLSISCLDDEARSVLSEGSFDQLNIVNGGEIWCDLQFLVPYKDRVRKLQTIAAFQSFRGLEQLSELVELSLSDQAPDPIYDFSALTKLQYCCLEWSRKMNGQAFFSLPELRHVSIYLYKSADFSEIGLSKSLRCLDLRYGRVDSLQGLAGCRALEELRLSYLRGLASLDGIEACRTLKTIEIDKGALSGDISGSLENLGSLEQVYLYSDKIELADLKWLTSNPGMAILRSSSVVRNIDWHVLFAAPKLYDVLIAHSPGSLPPDEAIKDIASQHGKIVAKIEHSGTRRSPWINIDFSGHR
jgi:hypothetical protein